MRFADLPETTRPSFCGVFEFLSLVPSIENWRIVLRKGFSFSLTVEREFRLYLLFGDERVCRVTEQFELTGE